MLNNQDVLFQRAKESDMIQGLLDTIELLDLEVQKINRFYPNSILILNVNYALIQNIQQLRNHQYNMGVELKKLRERGL